LAVLGPLDLRVDGFSVRPTPPKIQQVLALLAVHADQVVPVSSIFRELWDDEPPRTALRTTQTYIGQLRRCLADALGVDMDTITSEYLVTEGRGYALRTGAADLDLHEFERLAGQGREALALGDPVRADALLTAAARLWNGVPLGNVATGPILRVQVELLRELRLGMLEDQVQAKIALRREQEVLGELTQLAAEYPLNENLQGQLITVLHHCGRRAAALEVYSRLRTRLVEDLGLEPSQALRHLQQAALSGEPPVRDGRGPASSGRTRVDSLPAPRTGMS
jgi:SARP family transcriptional regulator, regulator of embCAB operon